MGVHKVDGGVRFGIGEVLGRSIEDGRIVPVLNGREDLVDVVGGIRLPEGIEFGTHVAVKHTGEIGEKRPRIAGGGAPVVVVEALLEGQGIVARGKLDTDGVFVAEEVLAKHDENYMPPEVADALKTAHDEGVEPAKQVGTP